MTRHREHAIGGALVPQKPSTLEHFGGTIAGAVPVMKPSTLPPKLEVASGGLQVLKPTTLRAHPMHQGGALRQKEDRWAGPLPKGWDSSSRDKYAASMAQADECEDADHPVSTCMDKIDGHVDDPGAFCASLHDRVTGDTHWRGKGK